MISALFWAGSEAKLVELVEKGVIEAYTSSQILNELERVLAGPKFRLRREEVSSLVEYFIALMHVIVPKSSTYVIREDPSDNRILECALEVKADYIVTDDKHLLRLGEFRGTKVGMASQALKLISEK